MSPILPGVSVTFSELRARSVRVPAAAVKLRSRFISTDRCDVKPRDHHRVYVVRLEHPRARGRPCFYVGMTGLPVEQRFANHKRGYKCSRIVQKYGIALAPEWYAGIPPMPYDEAALAEPTLADDLRDLGFLVFGPTNRRRQRQQRTTQKQ